jgi:Fibrinogen beta and gamma chains, C-terminal globular domain
LVRWYSEEYDWFYIDGESNGYALHVSAAGAGDAGDALNSPTQPINSVNGMQFYSYDKDSSKRCAAANGGGWWNNGCSSSNLMGSTIRGFVWNELQNGTENKNDAVVMLRTARMMMKPPA